MNNLCHYILSFLSFALLWACTPNRDYVSTEGVGIDKISRIELSPNGSHLIRDGKSGLRFAVRCYYYADAERTREVLFLGDRLPLDQIIISSSDGQTLKATEVYHTTSKDASVSFSARLNTIESPRVSVVLRDVPQVSYPPIRVPIVFYAVHTPRDEVYLKSFDREILQRMVDRANKVFAGSLFDAPSTANANREFYIQDVKQVSITNEEGQPNQLYNYITKNLMKNVDKAIPIWILNSSVHYRLRSERVAPAYTLGEQNSIPGLILKRVVSSNAQQNTLLGKDNKTYTLTPESAGIILSYSDMYRNEVALTEFRFEYLLGRYYGLLPTGYSKGPEHFDGNDVDFCDDTFTYDSRFNLPLKDVVQVVDPNKANTPLFFKSYNIMDKQGSSSALSWEQVKRIRQVIADCPYRQQGLSK